MNPRCSFLASCGQHANVMENRANLMRYGCSSRTSGPSITSVGQAMVITVPPEGEDVVFDLGLGARVAVSDILARLTTNELQIMTGGEAIAQNEVGVASNAASIASNEGEIEALREGLAAEERRRENSVRDIVVSLAALESDTSEQFQDAQDARETIQSNIRTIQSQVVEDLSTQMDALSTSIESINEYVAQTAEGDFDECFDDSGIFDDDAPGAHCNIMRARFYTMPQIVFHHNMEDEGRCAGCH